jgi:hypothetical protein
VEDPYAVAQAVMNPARSTGPAVIVGGWALSQLWFFWVAPEVITGVTIEQAPSSSALRATTVALLIAFTSLSTTASAFPPYRSTDAETADPWTLEARLGLVRIERDGDSNEYASPLLRANLGLPGNLELVSEFEYRPDEGQVGDAAMGFKWVPLTSALSLGVETLALLPVSRDGGAGVESILLATWRHRALRVHVNAGGFYDDRPAAAESGWKAGTVVELRSDRLRPGIEVFAKQERYEAAQVLLGPGVIVDFGAFDVRAGLHVGLTDEAPDLIPSLWVTTKLPLR